MGGLLPHLVTGEHNARLDSMPLGLLHARLVDDESAIRHERLRMAQKDLSLSLNDAAELVSKNAARHLKQTSGCSEPSS